MKIVAKVTVGLSNPGAGDRKSTVHNVNQLYKHDSRGNVHVDDRRRILLWNKLFTKFVQQKPGGGCCGKISVHDGLFDAGKNVIHAGMVVKSTS